MKDRNRDKEKKSRDEIRKDRKKSGVDETVKPNNNNNDRQNPTLRW